MDQIILLSIIFLLLVTIALGVFLLLVVYQQRITPGTRALIALTIGACLWSFGYLMEIISLDLGAKLFWAKFEYFGITTVPLAWLFFAFQLMGRPGWFDRSMKQRVALGIVPFLTLLLVWTNEWHWLIWSNVQIDSIGTFNVLVLQHGPGFWVYLIYAYSLVLFGSIIISSGLITSFQVNRWRNALRLFAVLIPWLGNLLYVTGFNPVPHLDWSPISFIIAGLLFVISLFRHPLNDILPIAQKNRI